MPALTCLGSFVIVPNKISLRVITATKWACYRTHDFKKQTDLFDHVADFLHSCFLTIH